MWSDKMKAIILFDKQDDADTFFKGFNKAFVLDKKEKLPEDQICYRIDFDIRRAGGRTPKFNETDINLMRDMRNTYEKTYTEIAERFGVSRQTVMKYLKE